jgi:hypothetical protein
MAFSKAHARPLKLSSGLEVVQVVPDANLVTQTRVDVAHLEHLGKLYSLRDNQVVIFINKAGTRSRWLVRIAGRYFISTPGRASIGANQHLEHAKDLTIAKDLIIRKPVLRAFVENAAARSWVRAQLEDIRKERLAFDWDSNLRHRG